MFQNYIKIFLGLICGLVDNDCRESECKGIIFF